MDNDRASYGSEVAELSSPELATDRAGVPGRLGLLALPPGLCALDPSVVGTASASAGKTRVTAEPGG